MKKLPPESPTLCIDAFEYAKPEPHSGKPGYVDHVIREFELPEGTPLTAELVIQSVNDFCASRTWRSLRVQWA